MRQNAGLRSLLRGLRRSINAARSRVTPSRRTVLTALVRLPLIGTVALSGHSASAARRLSRDQAHVGLTVAAVIDHMLPGGDLPGARALGIDQGIAGMTDRELRQRFAKGVAGLDAHAKGTGASNFLALDEAGREAALQAAFASGADGVGAVLSELRTLAFSAYYTHPTVMAAFAYSGPPQPAGFPDFQEAPR